MRSGWVKGSLLVFAVTAAVFYLSSIRREVKTKVEKLQRAHSNDSIRSQGILERMDKMEAHISKLGESQANSFLFSGFQLQCKSFYQIGLIFKILTTTQSKDEDVKSVWAEFGGEF